MYTLLAYLDPKKNFKTFIRVPVKWQNKIPLKVENI